MREHADCDDAINAALAKGDDGHAEYLATRCDIEHGPQTTERVAPVRAALGAEPNDAAVAAGDEER